MSIKELTVAARTDRLQEVLAFLETRLEELGCSNKAKMQIEIALEEIFVNVATYAYSQSEGAGEEETVSIKVEDTADPMSVAVTITDRGLHFNPLEKADPDVTLSAEERRIGGLGIYMVKKSMDHVRYEFRNGENILTFRKDL